MPDAAAPNARCRWCSQWFTLPVQCGTEGEARYELKIGVCPHCGAPYFEGRYGCVIAPVIKEEAPDA
jgi:hypothetical protein